MSTCYKAKRMETNANMGISGRLCIIFCIFLSVQLPAQDKQAGNGDGPDLSDSAMKQRIALFAELGGKGWLSLNVDYRIKETFSISAGIAGIEEGIAPNVMGYYFGGKRRRFETGGGLSLNFSNGGPYNVFVHGVVGYRLQKKKGLLFRAGFTPMVVLPLTEEGNAAFIPWLGISLGYCF